MVITIINNKGGTGKTTICVNLAASLANRGYSVLLLDLDSQASASLSLGISYNDLTPSLADVIFDRIPISTVRRNTGIDGLDLLTGAVDLANSDLMLADVQGRETCLTTALEEINHNYDFIICDCSPSLSMLTINALVASDWYIVPITHQYLSLEGLISLMDAVDRTKDGIGISTKMMGIVLNMVKPPRKQTRCQSDIVNLVRDHYKEQVFTTLIPWDEKLEEAPSHSKSVLDYANQSEAARQINRLTDEVLVRTGLKEFEDDRMGGFMQWPTKLIRAFFNGRGQREKRITAN